MLIALDFDNTYTADTELWEIFIKHSKERGHEVKIVTMRSHPEDHHPAIDHLRDNLEVHTVFCDGNPKRKFCEDLGLSIDIWIDDFPEGIHLGSQYDALQLQKWREEDKAKQEDLVLKVA